jgi:hypothetical protein
LRCAPRAARGRLPRGAPCPALPLTVRLRRRQGHKWVREVDVLSRHIDDQGRLHSTRLLSLYARMPLVLRAVFGGATRPFYLLENVIVDVEKQRMEVPRVFCGEKEGQSARVRWGGGHCVRVRARVQAHGDQSCSSRSDVNPAAERERESIMLAMLSESCVCV